MGSCAGGEISYSFLSGVSGTSIFNSLSLMAYNVVYTSIPVMVTAVLDKDIEEKSVLEHPEILYICQTGRYIFACSSLVVFVLFLYQGP